MSGENDMEDGIALALEAAATLRKKDPNHELLRYSDQASNHEVWKDFLERFGKPGLSDEEKQSYPAMAYVYAKYYIALREAYPAIPDQSDSMPECSE